jgi:predicted nucleic acid-binding protein
MYLIDTNIISEVRKGRRCHPSVASWYRSVRDDELYLSVLGVGEIRQGIERLRGNNDRRARTLEAWLEELLHRGVGSSEAQSGLSAGQITQSFAVSVIVFAANVMASFRQPLIRYCVFECSAATVDRPHPVARERETSETTSAAATGI